MRTLFILVLVTLFTRPTFGDNERKWVRALDLHPTQFSVGIRQVDKNIKKYKDEKDFEAYLKEHPVPVIVGPGSVYYMTDKHHMVRAAWEYGQKQVWVEIKKNYSNLDSKTFWNRMEKESLVYLTDSFGEGPRSPLYLPPDVRTLANDEYRSLSKEAFEKGCYDDTPEIPFAEFKWAEYFRKKVPIEEVAVNFKDSVKKALTFCHEDEAKDLPGYKK